jgi:hypothetical protein
MTENKIDIMCVYHKSGVCLSAQSGLGSLAVAWGPASSEAVQVGFIALLRKH